MSELEHFDNKRRRAWLGWVAALAGLAGAGVAWWRFSDQEAEVPVPASFWQLELSTPQGQTFRMASLQGAPLLINFWATWCPPCIEELPLLDDFYRQNASKKWQVLGLAVDRPGPVLEFLKQHPVSFPVAMAGSGGVSLSNSLGNSGAGLPFSVLLDAQGVLRRRKLGKILPQELEAWRALG